MNAAYDQTKGLFFRAGCSRPWENHSFAAVAAKNCSSYPKEGEEACNLRCRYSPVFLSPPAKRRRWEYSPLVLCSTRARSVSSPQSLRDEEAPSYVQQRHQALTRCVQTSFSLGKTLINAALSQPGKQPRAICSNNSINTQKKLMWNNSTVVAYINRQGAHAPFSCISWQRGWSRGATQGFYPSGRLTFQGF